METLDCFGLHDPMLNDDDDIQDAYCKLYNFCMKSLDCFTKLKAEFKKVKLEKDYLIAKLDEANNLMNNVKIKFHFKWTKLRIWKSNYLNLKLKLKN